MRINLSGVTSDFEPIPSGKYRCKITDGEIKEAGPNAKFPGSEMILWELTVQQGDYEGRKVFSNTTLLPHALFGLHNMLLATGKWDKEDLDVEDFDFEIDQVVGSDVIALVVQQLYDGEMRNSVKRLRPVSEEDLADSSLLP